MNRALAFLGVEPAEERSVTLMTAHAFFMGASTVFFETAVAAFFLARFDTRYLPWVYLAAAAVNMITGTAYSKIQHRVRFGRLMSGTLWFLLVSVMSIRLGLGLSTAAWLAFGGLVWYRVLSILTDLEYWAVAARVYDVRQAKRLFGLIGTGEVVARIAGAFSVPLLVRLGGVANLIVLSAASLAVCLVLLSRVLATASHLDASPTAETTPDRTKNETKARSGLLRVFHNRYLKVVVGVAVFATFGKYFVDFAFMQQMATRSKDEAKLASLLGIISGATQGLSLLTRLFVSRPLLHRFGVRLGLLVLPALHLLCTAGILATSALGGGASVVFWFAVANQGVYDTFKHPIDNPSFKVLYQPLARDARLTTQIAVEAVINPLVIGVAGGVMLLFSAVMHYSPGRFALVLFANFLAWLILGRLAGGAYMRAIVAMLRKRTEGAQQLDLDDATTRGVLRARLTSEAPAEVCFALQLLEKGGSKEIVPELVEHARHQSPDVRRYAIDRLTELDPTALWPMRRRLSTDPEASVRGSALRVIASERSAETIDELLPHLEDPDPIVRRAVVAHLLEIDEERAREAAKERILVWARSDQSGERRLAVRLAGEHALPAVVRLLVADTNPTVRRAALAAAGHLRDASFYAVLFEHLHERRFAETAVSALAASGESILDHVEERFVVGARRLLLARLAWICARVGGERAISMLCERLDFPDVLVRGAIVFALDRLRYSPPPDQSDGLRRILHCEVAAAAWAVGALRDLSAESGLDELRRALEADIGWARRRVLRILPLLYDRTAIVRAREHLGHASKEKRAYSLEVFDLTLGANDRDLVLPLLDDATPAERLARWEDELPQETRSPDERIAEIVGRPERWQRAWTRAMALRAAAERGLATPELVEPWLGSTDVLMREAAAWADARRRDGVSPSGERAMLLIEKIILLKTVPMFAETSEEVLSEVASVIEEVEYDAGQPIFSKGDVGDSMYIVVSGRVRVFDGDRTLSNLGETEIFGELALLDPEPRSASVEAIEDTRLFRLDDDTFSQLMAGNLEMVRGVLHVLCERLRLASSAAGA